MSGFLTYSCGGIARSECMPGEHCFSSLFTSFLLPALRNQAVLILARCGWPSQCDEVEDVMAAVPTGALQPTEPHWNVLMCLWPGHNVCLGE